MFMMATLISLFEIVFNSDSELVFSLRSKQRFRKAHLKNVRDWNSNGNVGDELVSIFFLLFNLVDVTRMARRMYHLGENENRKSGCREKCFLNA